MDSTRVLQFLEERSATYGALRQSAPTAIAMDRAAEQIRELRDMLAAVHYQVLIFPGVKAGTALAEAMKRIETEFGADPDFNKRWGA